MERKDKCMFVDFPFCPGCYEDKQLDNLFEDSSSDAIGELQAMGYDIVGLKTGVCDDCHERDEWLQTTKNIARLFAEGFAAEANELIVA